MTPYLLWGSLYVVTLRINLFAFLIFAETTIIFLLRLFYIQSVVCIVLSSSFSFTSLILRIRIAQMIEKCFNTSVIFCVRSISNLLSSCFIVAWATSDVSCLSEFFLSFRIVSRTSRNVIYIVACIPFASSHITTRWGTGWISNLRTDVLRTSRAPYTAWVLMIIDVRTYLCCLLFRFFEIADLLLILNCRRTWADYSLLFVGSFRVIWMFGMYLWVLLWFCNDVSKRKISNFGFRFYYFDILRTTLGVIHNYFIVDRVSESVVEVVIKNGTFVGWTDWAELR